MIDVAIIIVNWNVREYLSNCLRSIYAELDRAALRGEIWVVDNASTDGSLDLLSDLFPMVHLIANGHNPGFGAANNQGLEAARAFAPRYYFFLNPDTLLRPGSLGALIDCMDDRPDAGVAGARLVYGDGRFQHSAFCFPGLAQLAFDLFSMPPRLYETRLNGRYPRSRYDPHKPPFTVDHTLGATMMVRASVAEATQGFDESYHMFCEEIDWSWRITRAGWSVYAVPAAEIVHYGGQSTKQIPVKSVINLWHSRAQLYSRYHGRLTRTVASQLVQMGMRRKAARATDPALKEAYHRVAAVWLGQEAQAARHRAARGAGVDSGQTKV